MSQSTIYVATQTFNTMIDGQPALITEGITRVREGHPLLEAHRDYYKVLDVHYDVEDTVDRPGRPRGGNRRPVEADTEND